MQEHPVPQNITAYQFRLIGNMTIKQFLILLVGIGIGFFFYSTNLPFIIKWPFIIIFVLISIAMAFLPYEERTLDQWLVNFLRAIYRPTKFSWKRTALIPHYFSYSVNPNAKRNDFEVDWQPYRQQQVSAYLSSLGENTVTPTPLDPLDLLSQARTTDLDALFASAPNVSGIVPGKVQEDLLTKPDLHVTPRPLGALQEETAAQPLSHTMVTQVSGELAQVAVPSFVETGDIHSFSIDDAGEPEVPEESLTPQHHEAQVAQVATVTLDEHPVTETLESAFSTSQEVSAPNQPTITPATYIENTQPPATTSTTTKTPAVFNKDLPFPSLPTEPNMVIGMVHTPDHNIVPGAIVEILESESGMTVRALKTNSLGQFYSSSPLKPGTYVIETEADNFTFPIYELTVESEVLLPLDITAQL